MGRWQEARQGIFMQWPPDVKPQALIPLLSLPLTEFAPEGGMTALTGWPWGMPPLRRTLLEPGKLPCGPGVQATCRPLLKLTSSTSETIMAVQVRHCILQ